MTNLIDFYEDEPGDEECHLLSQDPVICAPETSNTGISWYFAVFLIVNAALGAGLLNFAKAFDSAGGILYSSVVHLALLIIVVGAMYMLSYCAEKSQSSSFQDIICGMVGARWQTLNSLCIIFYMFGCCVTFLILIGDQLEQGLYLCYWMYTVIFLKILPSLNKNKFESNRLFTRTIHHFKEEKSVYLLRY